MRIIHNKMFFEQHDIYCWCVFIKVRANFLRSHAKTGPFLPPSRLIARDAEVDPDMTNNNLDGRSEMGSECKYLKSITYVTNLQLRNNTPYFHR